MLVVKNLSYSYENRLVLDNISIRAERSKLVSILGYSGCGKSTLLNIISGILRPDKGEIFLNDQQIVGPCKQIAYMPQDDLLMPWRTIIDNVCLYADVSGQDKKQSRKNAYRYLELFGLKGTEHFYPYKLSGGIRQRAAFLRTILSEAEVLLLDKPFGALDAITRIDMQEWLKKMQTQVKKTIIMVTHDIDEAFFLSDNIILLGESPTKMVMEFENDSNRHGIDRDFFIADAEKKNQVLSYLRGKY